jgi:DNA-binding winged helix-turn-helix (wHTH) protein/tetratricopeptide (TPR) repeat protein
MSSEVGTLYRFDEFELHRGRRTLIRNGEKISLAPKTFDVLTYLVANAGRVVTKEELLKAVWHGSFVEEANLAQHIFALRKALGDRSTAIATLPGRGYQFTAAVHTISDLQEAQTAPDPSALLTAARSRRFTRLATAAVVIVLCALIGLGIRHRLNGAVVPGDHHEVVLANFQNSTGDPAFNHTLDTLLAIDLNQSPYLDVASDDDIHQILKLMDKPTDTTLTPPVAREVCQRINDQAVLAGAIASIGSKYLVTLSATDCRTGKILVQQKATADGREGVLKAVDTVAEDMRERLGESLKSHGNSTTPLELAHTFSLDALRAYSQALELTSVGKRREAIPLFLRAIELDPKFAAAWFELARTYGRVGEDALSREAATRAYQLRDQGDDFLRLEIVSYYNLVVTGDLHARLANFVTWTQMYPNQAEPWRDLASLQGYLGHPELAIEPARKALALEANYGYNYAVLCSELYGSGRLEDAKATCRQAIDRKIQNPDILGTLYAIAYFQHDTATMNEMESLAKGTDQEGDFRSYPLFAEGKAKEAVALWLRQGEKIRREGFPEHADIWLRVLLRREADYNLNQRLIQQLATIDQTKFNQNVVIANAELGRIAAAQAGLKLLAAQPVVTISDKGMNFPEARAAVALALNKPEEAIADLEIGLPIDNGASEMGLMRADAYLAARQPDHAITEYRKIVDLAYLTCTTQIYPLAHLGLARAFAMQGNHAAAKQEYETLFSLWKDADNDLPPLLQARSEYARLK